MYIPSKEARVKRGFLAIIFLVLYIGISAASLSIFVKLPDGSPAEGVRISADYNRGGAETFLQEVTDKTGKFKIIFKDCANNLGETPIYGHGVYRFIVEPKKYKNEYSDYYFWYGSSSKTAAGMESDLDAGKVQVAPKSELKWDVTLAKGKKSVLRFAGLDGKPLRGIRITMRLIDVKASAHKDPNLPNFLILGGFESDKNGEIIFENAFEGQFWVEIKNMGKNYCLDGMPNNETVFEVSLKKPINIVKLKKLAEKQNNY
jgi:hypothetical protein